MRTREIIEKTVTVIALICVLASGAVLEKKLNSYRVEKTSKEKLSAEIKTDDRKLDWDALLETNPDVKGWIYLPDSEIDYPILQGEDNDYYLHRDINRNYLYDGSIFLDSACEKPFKEANTVIYGHHMFSGAMFCGLDKFRDSNYWKDHSIFQIETPDESYDLKVVAYCNEPADSDLYLAIDDVPEEEYENITEEFYFTKRNFAELIRDKAKILSDEPFNESDTFVTLSTCAYNYEDARTQIIGVLRKVEPAQETEEAAGIETTEKKEINKWLLCQIGVAAIMAAALAGTIGRLLRR